MEQVKSREIENQISPNRMDDLQNMPKLDISITEEQAHRIRYRIIRRKRRRRYYVML